MNLRFDQVVPRLLEVCEGHPEFASLVERALLVRDLRGRVRLVIRGLGTAPDGDVRSLARTLQASLEGALSAWFHGPVLTLSDDRLSARRLAGALLDQGRPRAGEWPRGWPAGWPEEVTPVVTDPAVGLAPRWTGLQAVYSKESWISTREASPPWPLRQGTPRITAFHSFKGGVGRTTAMAMLAWRLARSGRRVVCIDLDVEAPGLGTLLLGRSVSAEDPSVLEWLLAHAATRTAPLDPPVVEVEVQGATLHVAPAGSLGGSYVEKLARLDLLRHGNNDGASPVEAALLALLHQIKRDLEPHHIMIDCRAGLHDIGGLALNDLAHVDVLVGRSGPQDLDGLSVVLGVIGRRRRQVDRRIVVLQTFLDLPLEQDESRFRRERHRSGLYDIFCEHLYAEPQVPAIEDDQAPHHPWPIGYRSELANLRWLREATESTLKAEEYGEVLNRLESLWASEVEAGSEGGA